MIILPTPPRFRGLDPDLPVTMYHRQLPLWRQTGATYFVTFRLAHALPQEKLLFLKRLRYEWERMHPPPHSGRDWEDFAPQVTSKAEAWLDEGYGACHFREPRWANDLQERLLHFQGVRYFVSSWGIMPNHWHLVLWPLQDGDLGRFMQRLTTTHVRRWHLHRQTVGTGHLYQGTYKSFPIEEGDRLYTVLRYVERNPVRPTLVDRAEDWQWSSLWRWEHPAEHADRPTLCPWPIPRPADWVTRVNRTLTKKELEAVRVSVVRGRPFGSEAWQESTAKQLGLESTFRLRGRPRKATENDRA